MTSGNVSRTAGELTGLPTMLPEELDLSADISAVLGKISGRTIEQRLIDIARIGGQPYPPTDELPERYGVNRVALTENDILARNEIIKPMMHQAGMNIFEHPLGLIGQLEGSEPELAPVVIMSHTDSVPNGDMYDGTLGIVGGIEAARAIRESNVVPKRSIVVLALTGEESARFGMALFGSRGMFHGLTDKELAARDGNGTTIQEALGPEASQQARVPFFKPNGEAFPAPHALIELHVEQSSGLDKEGIDLGIVKAIAAPVRFSVKIGDVALAPEETTYWCTRDLELTVKGKADHSGATPMGSEYRADGLVETSSVLARLLTQEGDFEQAVYVGEVDVIGGAINKVPGVTKSAIRLAGQTRNQITNAMERLRELIETSNQSHVDVGDLFGLEALSLDDAEAHSNSQFFAPEQIKPRQLAAFGLIKAVQACAVKHRDEQVVGTVGTFSLDSQGIIEMQVDVRGIDKEPRDVAAAEIVDAMERLKLKHGVEIAIEDLPGNADPVSMDPILVEMASRIIGANGIGSSKVMFSAAGHDAQNAARAGIPTVMLFCPSRNEGRAHHPDAYSSPEDIEKGVKALTALTLTLAA